MLKIEMDKQLGIVVLEPTGPLAKKDFIEVSKVVDPVIAEKGVLQGLIIHTKDFPGWDSFGALANHLKFVSNHHKKLSRIAVVTDSALGDFAEAIASHFVAAEIKHYPFDQLDSARHWILDV
jgi:hypothetical protein